MTVGERRGPRPRYGGIATWPRGRGENCRPEPGRHTITWQENARDTHDDTTKRRTVDRVET